MVNTPMAWSERAQLPTSWEAAGWTEAGQRERFHAVLRHLNLEAGDSLLDFGCGTGSFSDLLPADIRYWGYDWAPGMRERARQEHPERWFDNLDETEVFDHVVCIGTFNLLDNWSVQQTFGELEDLWRYRTRRSLVASLYRGDDLVCIRYEPADLLDFIRLVGCTRYVIDASYRENDILLEMRR